MENNQPLVSVIMNCFNSDKYLKEAIDSVLAQTYQNWELIFWDNQSTDNSANIVKSYKDDRIKYFYAHSFEPLYEARNLAIEKANGEYIAFLDCDDTWHNEKLKIQLNALTNSKYSFCYTNFYYMRNNRSRKAFQRVQPSGNIYKYQLRKYSVGIITVVIKKDCFMKMKYKFNSKYTYCGDFEFFIRFLECNNAIYINSCLAFYRVDNPNSISNSSVLNNIEEMKFAISEIEKSTHYDVNKELYILKARVNLKETLYYLKNSEYLSARNIIAPYKFARMKNFILYMITFLPPIIIKTITRIK